LRLHRLQSVKLLALALVARASVQEQSQQAVLP
jgi:hypothetical protein